MKFEMYSFLLGLNYNPGKDDCYGLARRLYSAVYGIELANYARPVGFDHAGLNLIVDNFHREGFQDCQTPELEAGDGLLFGVGSDKINHIGVYVGNQQFIHHRFDRQSCLDPLDLRWKRRLLGRVRHPDVTEYNRVNQEKVGLEDFLPPHLKRRLGNAG